MNYLNQNNDFWNPWASFRRDLDNLVEKSFAPAYEIDEEDGHYLISLETPGVAKDQFKIEVAENTVTISGENRRGKFQRSFLLPVGIDSSKIEANYQDGVLRLMVPKAEEAKPRQIKISNGSTGFFGKLLGDSKKREDSTVEVKESVA